MATANPKHRHADPLDPPEWVVGGALTEWRRVVGVLKRAKRKLSPLDAELVGLYIRTWTINHAAYRKLIEEGPTVELPNGIWTPTPHYKIHHDTSRTLIRILGELGCTPAARGFDSAKVAAADKSAEPDELDVS